MRFSKLFSGLFVVLGMILAVAAALAMRHTDLAATPAPAATVAGPAAMSDSSNAAMDVRLFRNIAQRVNPMVVAIMTRSRGEAADATGSEQFPWFFGLPTPEPESRPQRGLGSGFVVSSDGDILTNNHVVAGADLIEVSLFGDESNLYRAHLVGRDPLSDTALIRLDERPRNLPVAALGNSDALEPGDWVMAIGNPFQLGHTVTVGVVSYLGRPFEVNQGRWQKMIQTDASINPGNSGGPLLNVNGEVVGINAAILGAGSGGNIGIGFAVPINTVKNLLPRLRTGKVMHGRIGVQVRNGPVTADEAKTLGLPKAEGAIVTSVEHGSPAERAGVRPGDVIIGFNGGAVADGDGLVTRVTAATPGTDVALTVRRSGREQSIRVTIEELALDGESDRRQQVKPTAGFGLEFGDINRAVAAELRLPARIEGAVVFDVEPESAAARAGIMEGDVVLNINRRVVQNAADARARLSETEAGQTVFVLVWRDGNEAFLQMRREP